jgi:hypothetical protein
LQSGSLWNYSTSQLNLGQNEYYNGAYKYLTTGVASTYNQVSGGHYFKTASSGSADATITWRNVLQIASNGDLSLYEDTGTTPKFFWDASAEALGIGTSTPSQVLHLSTASTSYALAETTGTGTSAGFRMKGSASADYTLFTTQGTNQFAIYDNAAGTERLRIDASGDVKLITANDTAGTSKFLTFGTNSYNRAGIKCTNAATYDGSLEFYTGNASNFAERMRIDASGRVTMPYQPAFSVRPASAQIDIANNEAQVTLIFGTEIFDAGSNFASNTFTAPVTGKYQLSALIYTQNLDSAASYFLIALKTSNRTFLNIQSGSSLGADAAYYCYTLSILADMDASDTAYIFAQQGGGTSQVDIDTDSYFTGYLVA